SYGTSNKLNVARATIEALKTLKKTENDVVKKEKKGKEDKKKTPKKVQKDDLTKIEGIGPKIAELFVKSGIKTFADLAVAKKDGLVKILEENRLASHDPGSWSKQAAFARDGKWDKLEKWQDELKGGK
ncbi:MAG TPA: DUF4332 domain-containing protein, partial [Candidatus Pacebacteria bacterium]|nr:DUF4332 domain-containing protein [Candidatus Paceibacterota bacterium]